MGIVQSIRECYRYRVLIQSLVSRQLQARYRGSVLGFFWTFLNPLLLMAVYSLVFTIYMRFEMEDYGAFMFTGLLPWLWFASSLSDGTASIVNSGSLITRAMFPPVVLPVTAVLVNFWNFVFSLPMLYLVFLIMKVTPSWTILFLPAIMLVQFVLSLGFTLFLASLNVQYRDVHHLLGNILTFWFFLCPVLYPLEKVPGKLRLVALVNGMGSLVTAYQDVLFFGRTPDWGLLLLVLAAGVLILLVGDWAFRSRRENFAEYL
ncbi:MAG: ABC transporter permease [Candidatus Eisenbacteria bacterium]|nr:ABC transporter permease [Candidatus Eisenbacteria bacterium]